MDELTDVFVSIARQIVLPHYSDLTLAAVSYRVEFNEFTQTKYPGGAVFSLLMPRQDYCPIDVKTDK